MQFPQILSQRVKPELNHIYTEPPQQTIHGLDCGWYCREHALHLYGLAVLMGMDAEICLGDFILRRPGLASYHSVGDASDHAWCSIDECSPVDVSMTVKHIYPDISDIELVYGHRSDLDSGFAVGYRINAPDSEFMRLASTDKLQIAYNEKSRLRYPLAELLSEPFQFLHRPSLGNPTFQEIHGVDVFYAITYHCYRLVTEELRPLCRYRDSKSTVTQIVKYNPCAKKSIEALLS